MTAHAAQTALNVNPVAVAIRAATMTGAFERISPLDLPKEDNNIWFDQMEHLEELGIVQRHDTSRVYYLREKVLLHELQEYTLDQLVDACDDERPWWRKTGEAALDWVVEHLG